MTQSVKSKDVARLGKKIRRLLERRRHPMRYREICELYGWFNTNGKPSTGLVFKLAYGVDGKPYEPGREVRKRLGLRDICPACHRPFHKPNPNRVRPVLTEARKVFMKLPRSRQDELIEWALRQNGEL